MLLEEVREVFRAERQLTPMPSITAEELASFKIWASYIADHMGCASAMMTGSLSRGHAHPYSDIDLEMYTERKHGFQGFYHWNGRMVSLHVEPKWEMEEEVKNPYYQVWHREMLKDGLVIRDDDGFIKKIKNMAKGAYQIEKLDHAYKRLASEELGDEHQALISLNRGDLLGGLYSLSYYMEHTSVHASLLKNEFLSSEINLTQKFVAAVRENGQSPEDFCKRLKETRNNYPWDRLPRVMPENNGAKLPDITWEDTKVALRRILEYRRKIYGSSKYGENATTELFRLYCLGRVVGSYMFLSKAKLNFNMSASSLVDDSKILAYAQGELLSGALEGEKKASDVLMNRVCDILENSSGVDMSGYDYNSLQ